MIGCKPKIRFLIFSAFGIGGTVRVVLNVANHLAGQGLDVEIISIMRWHKQPFFRIDPRVKIIVLNDNGAWRPRKWLNWRHVADVAARRVTPSRLIHPDDEAYHLFSWLTDVRMARHFKPMESGVLITTRASLNLFSAEHVGPDVIKIGQEHQCYAVHPERLQRDIERTYRQLDAVVTLTEADRRDYERLLGEGSTKVVRIPNPIPEMDRTRAALDTKVIVAAGRFVTEKGFDLLIKAFTRVVTRHPDWKLKIFGTGPDASIMQRMIEESRLREQVFLMEPSSALEREFAEASLCAVSSRREGFAMIIIEAMSCGLPVVAFDCPSGPREIIRHGEDGLLVERENVGAFAESMLDLIEDAEKRKRLGCRARQNVQRFSIDVIGRQWMELIQAVIEGRLQAHRSE